LVLPETLTVTTLGVEVYVAVGVSDGSGVRLGGAVSEGAGVRAGSSEGRAARVEASRTASVSWRLAGSGVTAAEGKLQDGRVMRRSTTIPLKCLDPFMAPPCRTETLSRG
jgi:hypothetical protein